ncbi:MAG: acyl-CoA dehydrogenase family protein [Pseudomonadota bacterium]
MDFALAEEHQMLKDMVARFVREELLPLEAAVMERNAAGGGAYLTPEEQAPLDKKTGELGLWGLDAPEEVGGSDLPFVALLGVNIEMGRTVTPYTLPPDSPNLRMLMAAANEDQRKRYLAPYVSEGLVSAIGISEPGAGSDPAGMKTQARRDGDDWVLNGRKIWISRAADSDFTLTMALTDKEKGARGGMSAFIIDKGTPGFNILRKIPMIDGTFTYEIALEDCRVPAANLLGEEGKGFTPMQVRLSTRRLEMVAWAIGMAERALEMLIEYAPQRTTFGDTLANRQTIQNWVSDAAAKIRASKLMAYETAWKQDQDMNARTDFSMAKFFAIESAYEIVDHVMQAFGAMGMTKELPLFMMSSKLRTMRIYDGPSEIHRWVVARDLLGLKR